MDSYLEQLRRELEETMTVTSPDRMVNGPEGKWTPAQVLEHLFLTYHNTNRGLAKCLEKGTPLGTRIQQMEAGLAECDRRFGPRARILDHPVLGPLNVGEWRKFHWVHGKHHARQIRERIGLASG